MGIKYNYEYLDDNSVGPFRAMNGRRPYAVICHPWEGGRYIESYHRTASAAEKAADSYRARFERKNPGAYGYGWYPARRVVR